LKNVERKEFRGYCSVSPRRFKPKWSCTTISTSGGESTEWVGKEAFLLTERPWFDQETDTLLLDEYVVEMDSYKRIVEDGVITDTEFLEQALRVATLLRRL
jgi:hypothetical protein